MKKNIYLVLVLLFFNLLSVVAQKPKSNPFQMVEVPDSIFLKLEKAYKDITGFKNVNAGRNVWNLFNRKDFRFKNGMYSFKGQGPHFPRCLFIFNNNQLFIFKKEGAFSPAQLIGEYLKCIDELNLTNREVVKYLKVVSKYLEEEDGLTYGSVIKK